MDKILPKDFVRIFFVAILSLKSAFFLEISLEKSENGTFE